MERECQPWSAVADTYGVARWTRAQVEQFAPDDKSVKAALKLARPGPWSETGSTDTLVWGKCQGSGKTPYQVSVDLTGPAVKCTCPSRKFPCKHGVALLLLWVANDGEIEDANQVAGFAEDWAKERADKAAKKQARDANKLPPDPEAQAKRLANRLELMTAGANDFEVWLTDLYRGGFAAARQRPYAFWEAPAARLIDSQLPGLAQQVRDMPAHLYGDDWADRLLIESGRWFTAVRAWQRRDELDADDMGDLRAFIGWNYATDDIRSGEILSDRWLIEGQHRTDDGRLQSQRTWLRSVTTGRRFVVLDFAGGGAALATSQTTGTVVEAGLAPYPGRGVPRALFVGEQVPVPDAEIDAAAGSIVDALDYRAQMIAENPFFDRAPAAIDCFVRVVADEQVVIDDLAGNSLALVDDFDPWPLVAHAGPVPVALFGEISARAFRPLTVHAAHKVVPL